MGSRVSSESAGPAKLPLLGTSWYRRGVGYWLRRVRLVVFQLVFGGLFALLSVAIWQGIESGLPTGWHRAVDVVMGVLGLIGFVRGWIWGRRTIRTKLADPPTPEQAWIRHRQARRGRGSANPDFGRRGGALLFFTPFLPPCVAWWIGMTCAVQFIRELPSEVGARKALNQP
ncbi:hypothetical protein ACFPFX_12255 [Streptomyces mauvecolor]|uniref:Uncharacterized protein n=1 Tax=Streptomyces mauvecolor TaxID=58345 RepID=A0ABV9UJK6_9ACTN